MIMPRFAVTTNLSPEEIKRVEKAIKISNYPSRYAFMKDAVVKTADEILRKELESVTERSEMEEGNREDSQRTSPTVSRETRPPFISLSTSSSA